MARWIPVVLPAGLARIWLHRPRLNHARCHRRGETLMRFPLELIKELLILAIIGIIEVVIIFNMLACLIPGLQRLH
jgi:hypothetical protein